MVSAGIEPIGTYDPTQEPWNNEVFLEKGREGVIEDGVLAQRQVEREGKRQQNRCEHWNSLRWKLLNYYYQFSLGKPQKKVLFFVACPRA